VAPKEANMKRQILIGSVLGLLVLVLGGTSAQAIVLRYQPKVGTTTQSDFTMTGTMEMSAGTTSQTADTSVSGVSVEKVIAIVPEGRKVRSELRDARLNMNFQGMAAENKSQKLPDMSFVSIIDERGRTKRILSSSLADTEMAVGGDTLSELGGSACLPDKDVKPGDTWSTTQKITASGMLPNMTISMNFRLLELTTYKGRPVAKIRSSFSGPVSFDLSKMPNGVTGSAAGTLKGEATTYYDYERGVDLAEEGEVTMAMAISIPLPAEEQQEVGNMNMKFVTKFKKVSSK
jgi:hypothetical protein